MYEIRRSIKIVEQLKIGDEVLDIVIAPEEIVNGYNKAVGDIMTAQRAIAKAQKENRAESTKAAIEQYGETLMRLMNILLGEASTQKILAFYGGNKIEMSSWITPFLTNVIAPKMRDAANTMRNDARAGYRKAGRRGLFRR